MSNIYEFIIKGFVKFKNKKIFIIVDDNSEPWFNAKQSASSLGYKDPRDAIRRHIKDKDISQLKYINSPEKTDHPNTLYTNEPGLYSLILKSKLPAAEEFNDWITHDVIPSIRKKGLYELKKSHETKMLKMVKKLNDVKNEKRKMENDLKKVKFPHGGIVYAVDYSTKTKQKYRIGMSGDMNKRKPSYDTHTFHKKPVVAFIRTDSPIQIEKCIQALLYDYKYRNDFYICGLKKIVDAFKKCCSDTKKMSKSKSRGKSKCRYKSLTKSKPKLNTSIMVGGRYDIIDEIIIKLTEDKGMLKDKIEKINIKLNLI